MAMQSHTAHRLRLTSETNIGGNAMSMLGEGMKTMIESKAANGFQEEMKN